MPILSVEARNRSLDNDYGPDRGPNAPDAHQVILYIGDPRLGGLEVSSVGTGYVRPVLDSDTAWDPAADGSKANTGGITWADSTDSWGVITHWGLADDDDPTVVWDTGQFAVPIDATTPGGTFVLGAGALTIFYTDNLDPGSI